MKHFLLFLGLILLTLSVDIKTNSEKLINSKPKLLAQVPNGQKLLVGDLNDPHRNIIYIAKVKGTPFEMGQAYGKLFKDEIKQMLKLFYGYYLGQLEGILDQKIPKFIAHELTGGVGVALHKVLDLNMMITKRYTNSRYYEEINGIGKGAGINPREIARINLFPQLIKAACTVAGVWGNATQGAKTLHMRALDWDSKNPINKFPVVTVYQPSNKKWFKHANFAWAGFVGSLTGMSQKVTLGQKVWLPPKGSVQMTRYGNPWTYVFRDILYEAHNLQSAISILSTTHRTCAIHIGLGSVQDKSFRMFEYSQKVLNIYDDNNYTHYAANHPKKAGIAYFDKHVQPSKDSTVGQVLTSKLYGHWEMESLWRVLGMTHSTGDTQLVVFNLEDQQALIAYSEFNGTKKAFERSPILLEMDELFEDF